MKKSWLYFKNILYAGMNCKIIFWNSVILWVWQWPLKCLWIFVLLSESYYRCFLKLPLSSLKWTIWKFSLLVFLFDLLPLSTPLKTHTHTHTICVYFLPIATLMFSLGRPGWNVFWKYDQMYYKRKNSSRNLKLYLANTTSKSTNRVL